MQPILLKRSLTRYVDHPVSVRNATRVIIVATSISVIAGGIVMRLVEPEEYPDLGVAFWWAIQTVTTVGYGDVTPTSTVGRLVGSLIMLQAIAFITVVTASITSSFVERMRRQQSAQVSAAAADTEQRLHARFDELVSRLDRIERAIDGPQQDT